MDRYPVTLNLGIEGSQVTPPVEEERGLHNCQNGVETEISPQLLYELLSKMTKRVLYTR